MKRLWFLVGIGAGFLLGSRAGTGPYQQLEANIRRIAGQPEVQGAVHQVRDVVQDKVNETAQKISDTLPKREETTPPLISH
jgi:hypothetical protein